MKKLFVLTCMIMINLSMFGQTSLVDLINKNKNEFPDGSYTTYSNFSSSEMGSGGFELKREKYDDYDYDYEKFNETITWNWKDIISISLNENSIFLVSSKYNFKLDSKNAVTGEIATSRQLSSLTIYFLTSADVKQASIWIADKVKSCGGSVRVG